MKRQLVSAVFVGGLFIALSVMMHVTSGRASDNLPKIKHKVTLPFMVLESAPYQVNILSWGVLEPVQQTQLSSQVSGKIDFIAPAFEQGGIVQQGALLFSIDSADYDSRLVSAEAELASKLAALEQEYALVEVAKVQWQSAENPTDLALRKPQLDAAKANVKAAREQVNIARRDLSRCKVYAPFNAVVQSRDLGLGQVINASTVVASLAMVDEAKIIAPVAHFDMPFIAKQQKQEVKVRLSHGSHQNVSVALEQNQQSLTGYVAGSLGFVDAQTRMNQLVIKVADPYGLGDLSLLQTSNFAFNGLAFGSFVEVDIPSVQFDDVFQLPQHLVNQGFVWIIDNQDALQQVVVEVVREEADVVYVRGGLKSGDRLVMQLPEFPRVGMAVQGIEQQVRLADVNADSSGDDL